MPQVWPFGGGGGAQSFFPGQIKDGLLQAKINLFVSQMVEKKSPYTFAWLFVTATWKLCCHAQENLNRLKTTELVHILKPKTNQMQSLLNPTQSTPENIHMY